MTFEPSSNTKAILLLTAPLIAGRGKDAPSVKPLGAGEYRRLARRLRELQRQPADLLDPGAREIVREALMKGRLALVSPYDPAARFQVGHAMQRNKLIYALSDAALVVNSDYGKGGTWTGAVEQLDKLKLVPVHVRANGEMGKGLEGLRERGAKPWPEPKTPEALEEILDAAAGEGYGAPGQQTLSESVRDGSEAFDKAPNTAAGVECGAPTQRTPPTDAREESAPPEDDPQAEPVAAARLPEPYAAADSTPADELFAKVRDLIGRMDGPRTEDDVAEALQIPKKLAGVWLERFIEGKIRERFKGAGLCETEAEIADSLQIAGKPVRVCLKRLVEEGALDKLSRPVRYRSNDSIGLRFDE